MLSFAQRSIIQVALNYGALKLIEAIISTQIVGIEALNTFQVSAGLTLFNEAGYCMLGRPVVFGSLYEHSSWMAVVAGDEVVDAARNGQKIGT